MTHATPAEAVPATSMRSAPRKRGRPVAEHRRPDGTKAVGLARHGDGRWRVSATGETFFEPDEHLALARFEQIMAAHRGDRTVDLPLPPQPDLEAALAAMSRAGGTQLKMVFEPGVPTEYKFAIDSDAFWACVRYALLDDPRMVALKTGVEWVGRGAGLPKETPSPTLAALGKAYADKPRLSPNEAGRSKLFWKQFVDAVRVVTVRELTHEAVARYEAVVEDAKLAPKSKLHRYRKVRTILAYAIKRGLGVEDCRRALDLCAMLEVKEHTPLDPDPIELGHFRAIHREALAAGDHTFAAMMVMSLNACLYAGEAAAVRWDELDLTAGTFVSRRPKTGVSRIAVLWPETVRALGRVSRAGDHVFNTRVRSYTVYSVLAAWRTYRERAGVDDAVKFSQIRDAAYTTAVSISFEQSEFLAGHRLPGSSDHYLRRNPALVATACEAIHKAFAPFPTRAKHSVGTTASARRRGS